MARVIVRSGPGLVQQIHREEPRAMIDRIQRRITLAGALDATRKARLAEIAKKCPVHKTLVAGLRVEDEIVMAGA